MKPGFRLVFIFFYRCCMFSLSFALPSYLQTNVRSAFQVCRRNSIFIPPQLHRRVLLSAVENIYNFHRGYDIIRQMMNAFFVTLCLPDFLLASSVSRGHDRARRQVLLTPFVPRVSPRQLLSPLYSVTSYLFHCFISL